MNLINYPTTELLKLHKLVSREIHARMNGYDTNIIKAPLWQGVIDDATNLLIEKQINDKNKTPN